MTVYVLKYLMVYRRKNVIGPITFFLGDPLVLYYVYVVINDASHHKMCHKSGKFNQLKISIFANFTFYILHLCWVYTTF